MSDSPDTEVAFRNPDNIEDTGAQGDDDRFYDTVEDHGTYRRDRGEGDVPDIGKGAHGFNRIDLDGNGTYYPTGSSYRIAIKPESYDGVEVWEEYISHFDICAELGKWRDQDKVLALAAALKGPARTFYISLSQTEKRSYHILVQRLGQRFGSKQEKTYRRMSELLKHTEKRHQSLTDDVKTSSFFSEANGFWLSIHPEDYARLIKPTDHDTILAIRTRAAVSRWLERTGTSSRSRQQWEDGWKTQDKSKKHIHEQPTSGNPPYSPSRPSMEEQKVQLASLNFCSSGNIAYLTSKIGNGEIWFKADLSEKVFDDKRAAESLIRRMKSNHSTTTTPKHFTTEVKDISGLTKSISKVLGIRDIHIKKITRQTLTFEITKKRKMQELAEELEISDEIELMETYIQETDQITENGTSENTIRVVPMIPPARREWRTIATSIEIGTARIIVWPPENWEELSADDRLTAWQFVAMSLEYNLGVKSVTNKSDLLDKYAMLALPGTSLDMTSHTNGISQARLLNFNILKGIYMGNMKEAEANVWLATLEAATAVSSKDTEGLLQVIKDVPLRLTLENSASNIST